MLSEEQHEQFEQDGFLVLNDIIPEAALAAVEEAFSQRLDELATYLDVVLPPGLPTVNEKMLALEEKRPGACLIFTHSHILSPALFALWSDGPLADVACSILGPDIDGHPFFAARPKPPGVGLYTVPWHQDSAYLRDGAQVVPQVAVWLPLMDATRENGCMEFARGGHRQRKELPHVPQEDYTEYGNRVWYVEIPPSVATSFDVVTCEVSRGSCIVFSHLTPHRSLPNHSSSCRWSIDLRYLLAGGFAGTNQAPIPFRRQSPLEAAEAEEKKRLYIAGQMARDRNAWVHRIENAVWQNRWMTEPAE